MKKLMELYEARPFDIKGQPDKGKGIVQAVGTKNPTRMQIPAQILSWAGMPSGVKLRVSVSNGQITLTMVSDPTDAEISSLYGKEDL